MARRLSIRHFPPLSLTLSHTNTHTHTHSHSHSHKLSIRHFAPLTHHLYHPYGVTSLIINSALLRPCSRTMLGALWWSCGGSLFLMSEVPLCRVATIKEVLQNKRAICSGVAAPDPSRGGDAATRGRVVLIGCLDSSPVRPDPAKTTG